MKKDFLGLVLKEKSPTVIYTCNRWMHDSVSLPFLTILEGLRNQRVVILMGTWWTVDPQYGKPASFCSWIKELMNTYENLTIIACANSVEEYEAVKSEGVEVILANQNMFIDENFYFPIENQTIKFDAIYNAQFLPFKRHELLEGIDSLALIGYNHNSDEKYMARISTVLKRATLLNFDESNNVRFLNKEQCNVAYNMSSSGLCLSKAEGAMYASMEYLMSGLIVISTKSSGGRDYFFDANNSIIVPDDPLNIKEAIKSVKNMKFDRNQIRSDVLEHVGRERRRFISEVDKIIKNESGENNFLSQNWSLIFVNKLMDSFQPDAVISKCVNHG